MPPKKSKVSVKVPRPTTRSTTASVAAESHNGSPPPEPPSQAPVQQSTNIESLFSLPPSTRQLPPPSQVPQVFIPPASPSPRMSIGAMPITPGERTVRIQSDAHHSPAPSAPLPFGTYKDKDESESDERDSEEDNGSEDDRRAVEYEVSRIEGGSNTDKQTTPNPVTQEEALDANRPADLNMVYTKRRSEYLANPRLDRAREKRLENVHQEVYPGIELEDFWLDPAHEERDLSHIFALVDQFLSAKQSTNHLDRFYLDSREWMRIHKELTDLYQVRKLAEPSASVPLPPPWPGRLRSDEGDPSSEYNFAELEDLCILYRHSVETWLAQVWETKPLTKEDRIEKLPTRIHLKWKRYFADQSTAADELRETFGSEYEEKVEEDTMARLTMDNPERDRSETVQKKKRTNYPNFDDNWELRNQGAGHCSQLWEEPVRTRREDSFATPRHYNGVVRTPSRLVPDHLGDRNRGQIVEQMFAPSQFAQGTSTVQRPRSRVPVQTPVNAAGGYRRYQPGQGPPGDDSSDSNDPRRPPRRSGNGGGLPNFPPNRQPNQRGRATPFIPPPPPPIPRRRYGAAPPGPPGGGGIGDTFSWDGCDDQGYPVRYYVDQKPIKLDYPHIEMKLKPEYIEEWDGDTDKLVDWMEGVNFLADRSPIIWKQLGSVVPTRFRKNAKTWWYSLPWVRRADAAEDWDALKAEIRSYYMGRSWLDRQKLRAKNATYRDSTAPKEKPSEYYIRKLKLLHTAEAYTQTELILAIMEGAPKYWHSVIDTSTLRHTVDLQDKIIYHEDALMYGPGSSADGFERLERRIRAIEQGQGRSHRYTSRAHKVEATRTAKAPPRGKATENPVRKDAHAHLIGFHKDLGKPPYPRDDKTLAKGKSPEEKGARPCRHCGSPKHWDNECKYARKGAKKVKTNFANPSNDYLEAMSAYEEAYLDASSEEKEPEEEDEAEFEDYVPEEEEPESEN